MFLRNVLQNQFDIFVMNLYFYLFVCFWVFESHLAVLGNHAVLWVKPYSVLGKANKHLKPLCYLALALLRANKYLKPLCYLALALLRAYFCT